MICDFNWEVELEEEKQLHIEALLKSVLDQGLRSEAITAPVEISITITTAEAVHQLNREYRGIDRTTDVLSFPLVEFDDGDRNESILNSEWDPVEESVMLGDIVINYEQALAQAEEYGHSADRELAFLTAHSLLHLLGYDHREPEEEQTMQEHQERILTALSITR